MPFLKSLVLVVLTIIVCGLEAKKLTWAQQTKCIFTCPQNKPKTQGACAKVIASKPDYPFNPTKWNMQAANPVRGHPGYFNCIGSPMEFATCALPAGIPQGGRDVRLAQYLYDKLLRFAKGLQGATERHDKIGPVEDHRHYDLPKACRVPLKDMTRSGPWRTIGRTIGTGH
ncbi:hypothetical protein PtB15_6B131 [Puccinia triticina]|nr:hypothetical protein PtB15_6B131 [Puccinia triticina]